MRNIIIAFTAIVFSGALFAGSSDTVILVQNPPAAVKSEKKIMREMKKVEEKFMGTVESVNTAEMKISIRETKGMLMEFALNNDTRISKGRKILTLSEKLVGEEVTVVYTGTYDQPVVKHINVHVIKTIPAKR